MSDGELNQKIKDYLIQLIDTKNYSSEMAATITELYKSVKNNSEIPKITLDGNCL